MTVVGMRAFLAGAREARSALAGRTGDTPERQTERSNQHRRGTGPHPPTGKHSGPPVAAGISSYNEALSCPPANRRSSLPWRSIRSRIRGAKVVVPEGRGGPSGRPDDAPGADLTDATTDRLELAPTGRRRSIGSLASTPAYHTSRRTAKIARDRDTRLVRPEKRGGRLGPVSCRFCPVRIVERPRSAPCANSYAAHVRPALDPRTFGHRRPGTTSLSITCPATRRVGTRCASSYGAGSSSRFTGPPAPKTALGLPSRVVARRTSESSVVVGKHRGAECAVRVRISP
jgi:hypothetical protein